MNLTFAQQEAVAARGNVLVVAGAGTGKTRTLVERCLSCLLEGNPPASLDEILMVTFTEAAAAEMRQRIRARLEQQLKAHPEDPRWPEQLALFESAHIGTLHSFCLQLVRQHFYELELDPQLTVLAEGESRLLADETLDEVLRQHYAGEGAESAAVRQLIQTHGRGSDPIIRSLALRLHDYAQTRPDAAGWMHAQLDMFSSGEPILWQQWLLTAFADWHSSWLPRLAAMPGNPVAARCAQAFAQLRESVSRAEAALVLEEVGAASLDYPKGKKTAWVTPLQELFDEAEFLLSLARVPEKAPGADDASARVAGNGDSDPLQQDWEWVRSHMATLLRLAGEFTAAFSDAKRERGVVDFHDLEQHALKLLWYPQTEHPTPLARQWQQKLRFVFVDEYQDINAAQDKIIQALSREDAQANRFLVGDVKQSIYRFRLANPSIFQGYVRLWSQGTTGKGIPLVDNFRSREGILDFINSLFSVLMREGIGGVLYNDTARLRFAAAAERSPLSAAASSGPSVELHLHLKGRANHSEGEEPAEGLAQMLELEDTGKEARRLALRLRELKAQPLLVWDEKAVGFRPVEWSDMAVLLRSPANKAESYAKEFSRLNVPLLIERGGFYESLEVTDLLSLLQILDNPLQDLPLLAVLRSPLVGLTLNELAAIRLAERNAHFWTALLKWEQAQRQPGGSDSLQALSKVGAFLERFARWRRLARQLPLSRCLDAVLTETLYGAWLLTQPRGEQRHANVQRLLGLAQQFDQFQRQGLFRFLCFVEGQQLAESEPDVAPMAEENSVRLMSIHQSKGLEFPVVAVADLGKAFNLADLRADIILDEQYGLCPQIKAPHTGKRYPSLPYWMARRRQRREMLGEELRLLYVAMTRARDKLVLSAGVPEARYQKLWQGESIPPEASATTANAALPVAESGIAALLSARCCADWLGLWFAQHCGPSLPEAAEGQSALLRWTLYDDRSLAIPAAEERAAAETAPSPMDSDIWGELQQRLSWNYRFPAATRQPAKTSVSALRRSTTEQEDQEAVRLFRVLEVAPAPHAFGAGTGSGPRDCEHQSAVRGLRTSQPTTPDAATHVGNAHHAFLQRLSLEAVGSSDALRSEAHRLEQAGALTAKEGAILDFDGLAAFWNSDLGLRIREQARFIERELPFTTRFATHELAALTGQPLAPELKDEFVVVQGVADLAVLLPKEIWLLDFKTDNITPERLLERAQLYEPQLALYARALSQIYRRPVTECWLYFLAARSGVALKELVL